MDWQTSQVTDAPGPEWKPPDQAALFNMEQFETGQFAVTEPLLHKHLQSLIAAQVLIVNSVHRALEQQQTGDATTPVFGLAYRVVDDLRVAQHLLLLGYIVQATLAARDSLETAALCLLLAKHPDETERYYAGEQFGPSAVRKVLASAGDLDAEVLAGAQRTYGFLSKFTHPNVEGLAYTIDEVDRGGGNVNRTFRAGGTNEPKRLLMFGTMCVGTAMTAAVLVVDALAPLMPTSDHSALHAGRAVLMALAVPAFASAVKEQTS
jgi:hypothetical protein